MADAQRARSPKRMHWLARLLRDPAAPTKCHKLAHLISDHVNKETNDAWASQRAFAEILGVNQKTVQRGVAELEALDYLDVVRANRLGPTNRYRLRLPGRGDFCVEVASAKADRSGQNCPIGADNSVRQSNLNNHVDSDARIPDAEFSPPPSGKPKHPARQSPAGGQRKQRDRGAIELAIAKRLGSDGPDRLAELPEEQINRLCALQRLGRLSDHLLFEAVPPRQASKGLPPC